MAKNRYFRIVAAVVCAAIWLASLPSRAAQPPANHLDLAKAAADEKHYAAAVDHLAQFAKGSIVEARADEGRDLLLKIAADWSAELERQGKIGAAAGALLRCAEALGADPHAEDLRTNARQMLEAGYDKAMTAKDAPRALSVATAAGRLFPNAPPIAPEATLKILEVDVLASQLLTARPEYLFTRFRALEAQGVLPGVFAQHKIRPDQLLLRYARDLHNRGWFAEEIRVLQEALAAEGTPAEAKETDRISAVPGRRSPVPMPRWRSVMCDRPAMLWASARSTPRRSTPPSWRG